MQISLHPAPLAEIQIAFDLLKHASEKLESMGINQWDYWQNPPQEKVDWVKSGYEAKEFFFIQNEKNDNLGMVRILDEDQMYWGKQTTMAKYIHSLVVHEAYAGQKIGETVVEIIRQMAKKDACPYLRLDCDASNPLLCNYYTKQGFVKVGEKELPLGTYNLYQKEI